MLADVSSRLCPFCWSTFPRSDTRQKQRLLWRRLLSGKKWFERISSMQRPVPQGDSGSWNGLIEPFKADVATTTDLHEQDKRKSVCDLFHLAGLWSRARCVVYWQPTLLEHNYLDRTPKISTGGGGVIANFVFFFLVTFLPSMRFSPFTSGRFCRRNVTSWPSVRHRPYNYYMKVTGTGWHVRRVTVIHC